MLELCNDEDLAQISGGLNWEGNPLSENVIDLRTPLVIGTPGDFARYDRGIDAVNAENPYWDSVGPIATQGEIRAYDDMMVALDKLNDDFVCSNLFGDPAFNLDLTRRLDVDTPGEFQRWDKTDSPGGYDGNRGNTNDGFQPTDFNQYADAAPADGGDFASGGDFACGGERRLRRRWRLRRRRRLRRRWRLRGRRRLRRRRGRRGRRLGRLRDGGRVLMG